MVIEASAVFPRRLAVGRRSLNTSQPADPVSRQPAHACFVAGTLVHAKQGLVPIEQLKVGDLVLSSPASGKGGQEYKRVVKTVRRNDQGIMKVIYKTDQEPDRYKAKYAGITTTYDHPFWAEGEGWATARSLHGDFMGPSSCAWSTAR